MPCWMTNARRWAAVAALFLAACGQRPHISSSIDAIAGPNALAHSAYVLMPGNKGATADDLQYQEYAAIIDRALAERGMRKSASFDDAQVVVFLRYGIGEPETRSYTYNVPVFGQTGVASSYTSGNVNVYGNSANYSQSTSYTPSYGITGYATRTGSYTTYTRFLVVNAVDIATWRRTEKLVDVWRASIVSVGSEGDLRLVFPYMVVAGKRYFGASTGSAVTVNVYSGDPEVAQVRGVAPKR